MGPFLCEYQDLGQLWLTGFFTDTVTDFSWEPRGERFAIISTSDPNVGNAGPGVTIKTDVSFYQLDHGKNDFKLLSACVLLLLDSVIWRGRILLLTLTFPRFIIFYPVLICVRRNVDVAHKQHNTMVTPRTARRSSHGGIALEVGTRILGPGL